ncbi:MAG: helix-turn-helix domain-containing protein [Tannerella sp.]|jgi:transcriptional regulator with XRE-family HTH domain|nr:helix-turn-helix domain-containing protein [Tannerella sp.]
MNKSMDDFRAYCKKLRIDKKLTMTSLANKVEKTQSYISQVENDKIKHPPFKFIKACMEAYELQWPETMEFFEKALSGIDEISVPVQTSIIPKPMLAKLLAAFLAADMKTGFQHNQWEAVKSVIEEINGYLDKTKKSYETL